MLVIASSAFVRAGDASATTRGAVIHLCVLGTRSCLATTASGRARLVVVDDRGGVIRDDVVVELDGGAVEGDGRVERRARLPGGSRRSSQMAAARRSSALHWRYRASALC